MKFCINITSGPLAGSLEDDDLRGEGRWERNIARGLLRTGVDVGTPLPKWAGDAANWVGQITDLSDSVYIAIYGGFTEMPRGARAYVIQFFSPPNAAIEDEIRAIMAREGHRNVFVSHSYPSDGCLTSLAPDLADRGVLLPVPGDAIVSGDPTTNHVLFHPARYSLSSLVADGGVLMRWVRHALARDERLTFESVSGPNDANSREAILSHPLFDSILGDVHHRLVIYPSLTHPEVQHIYARTRLVVCPSGYGGPPLESARHGIPVVALERDCSLFSAPYTPGFPELPRIGADGSLTQVLERLLTDTDYARRVGDAGRRYTEQHFSADAFARALRGIVERIR